MNLSITLLLTGKPLNTRREGGGEKERGKEGREDREERGREWGESERGREGKIEKREREGKIERDI